MDRPKSESKTPYVVGLLLLAGLIAGGSFWFFSEDQTKVEAPVAKVEETVAPLAETPVIATEHQIQFAYNEATLDDASRRALDGWAERLLADKLLTVQLEGFCDERGSEAYNLKLGERRGDAAREYLIAKGVNAPRLKVVSFGESRPLESGHTEAAWAANRRVEFKISNVVSQR
jgi:peptidoglycan-associated lipoprotein